MFSARVTPYQTFGGFAAFAAALTASACGGKAVIDGASAAGAASTSGGSSQGGSASVGASGSGTHPGGTSGLGGASPVVDAGVPAAGAFGLLPSCVNAHYCSLTAADVACNVDSDCSELEAPTCGEVSVIGVNQHSKASCVAPPCLGLPGDAGCPECPVYHGEDCSQVQTITDLGVHCVAHVCLSYYPCVNCIEY